MIDLDGICWGALRKWGFKLQLIVTIEELAELIHEITRLVRLKDTDERLNWTYWNGEDVQPLAEEIADVELMLQQIKLQYNLFDDVKYWKKKKLVRVLKRLK